MDHVIWAFLLFTPVTVPEALNCELMHRKGKPYHLFSHIFLPSFAHTCIISNTHVGIIGPWVIGITLPNPAGGLSQVCPILGTACHAGYTSVVVWGVLRYIIRNWSTSNLRFRPSACAIRSLFKILRFCRSISSFACGHRGVVICCSIPFSTKKFLKHSLIN